MKPNEIITQEFLKVLESEKVLPWRKPWKLFGHQNLFTGTHYRGFNRLMTSISPFSTPYWGTFNQISKAGGSIKEGSHGTIVCYYNRVDKTDEAGEIENSYWLLKYYRVFNLEQTEGIEIPKMELYPTTKKEDIDKDIESYIARTKLTVKEKISDRAYYSPSEDVLVEPMIGQFSSVEEFYSTYFHELIHSTGHWDRLCRFKKNDINPFGSSPYAKEELIAELGSAFLRGFYGILAESQDNSAAYLHGWIEAIKGDSNLIISAAGAAQKAYDYFFGGIENDKARTD